MNHVKNMPIQFESHTTHENPLETFLFELATSTDRFSAADIANVCRIAASIAVSDSLRNTKQGDLVGACRVSSDSHSSSITPVLTPACFRKALQRMRPSVSVEQEKETASFCLETHLQTHF